MCWIASGISKNIPVRYIKHAYKAKNKHGFGIMWHDGTKAQAYKTKNYKDFRKKMKELNNFHIVIHLRYATVGHKTSIENIHPFPAKDSYFMHNGTIFGLKDLTNDQSDTSKLADMLNSLTYSKLSDIQPLLHAYIGDTLNRLVFVNNDGTIDIMNKHLGIDDPNGNWYSNDYHIKPKENLTKVFVYGTLKTGFHNHKRYLADAKKLCNAKTKFKMAMIGKGLPFPYMLGDHPDGHNVEGEVYEVNEKQLRDLDYLEGVPTHYRKRVISVVDKKGETIYATCYIKTKFRASDYSQDFIQSFTK